MHIRPEQSKLQGKTEQRNAGVWGRNAGVWGGNTGVWGGNAGVWGGNAGIWGGNAGVLGSLLSLGMTISIMEFSPLALHENKSQIFKF